MSSYYKMFIVTILPAILTVLFIILEKYTAFKKLNKTVKQVIYGIFFGGLAVLGTEWGIPINGAQANARDAAVLTAGLIFGPLAGIIAGLIGGIERYFAVYWGVGAFTQIACTVSTILAGFYSAALRKYMFDNKRPSWSLAFAIGLVMEVFHLTMVFVTNMADTTKAMEVVKACSAIMIAANSVSVMLSSIVTGFFYSRRKDNSGIPKISQTVQKWLLVCVSIAFVVSSFFVFELQNAVADTQTRNLLELAIEDVKSEVEDASDTNLLNIAFKIATETNTYSLEELCELHGVAEISLVDKTGMIYNSTNSDFIGFDMASGPQSAEFLCLLNGNMGYVQEYGPITLDPSIYRKFAGVKTSRGFLQIGYDAKQFQKDIAMQVESACNHRRVGETGYLIIADMNRNVVSAPDTSFRTTLDSYGFGKNDEPGVVFRTKVNTIDCFCLYEEAEGYYFVSVLPVAEAYNSRTIVLYANTFLEILVFGVMFAMIYMVIKRVVVNNLNKVNASLAKITGGNLDEKVEVNSNFEFASLSDDINETVDALKRYIAEASARIDEELKYAANIQISSLPHVFPKDDRFEVYALMDAAKEVGGDFYDVFKTKDNGLNFLVADVSGKGIPGAMFMMRAKSVLHSFTENNDQVNEVFTQGNESLCSGNDAGMFVTAWQGNIDLETGLVNYACAGHNPPVLKHASGECEYIKGKPGFVLAGMEGIQYRLQQIQLEPGDILFLYTDGVTEATSIDKELYGEERLINALNSIDSDSTMDKLCNDVLADVNKFVDIAEQFDDITMVALKYKGKGV